MVQWISDRIYTPKYKCDAEDIFQHIQIELWKYNSFQNFIINEDDEFFHNTFDNYLKDTIIRRAIANYLNRKNKLLLEFVQFNERFSGEHDDNPHYAQVDKSIAESAKEKFRSEEFSKSLREVLENLYQNTPNRGNLHRDINMFIKNKIDGYSIAELGQEFGVNPNTVNTAIWRVENKRKVERESVV